MKPIFKEDMDVALRFTLFRDIARPAFKDRIGQGKGAHTCPGDHAINALDENARDINLVAMLGDQLFFSGANGRATYVKKRKGLPVQLRSTFPFLLVIAKKSPQTKR